jgi:hypothetical protein
MKTSTLYLRPFVPGAVEMGRTNELIPEPCAKLIYGGVTIEIPYTIFGGLSHAVKLHMRGIGGWYDTWCILDWGLEEIEREMGLDLDDCEKCNPIVWFRDNPEKCSLEHVWCPIDLRRDTNHYSWDRKLKSHTNTKWRTRW